MRESRIEVRETESTTLSKRQINLKVEYYAEKNPREASKFCLMHETEGEKSLCIKDVAIKSGVSAYCEQVIDKQIKDNCYFELVLENPSDDLCRYIESSTIRANCQKVVYYTAEAEKYQKMEMPSQSTQPVEPQYDMVPANFY